MWAFVILFCLSCLLFGSGLIAGLIARFRGYRPWFWLLSLGPVGTLVILLQPKLRQAATPEMREAWEKRADWTGGILTGITLFLMTAVSLLGVTYLSIAATTVSMGATVITQYSSKTTIEGVDINSAYEASSVTSSTSTFVEGDRQGTRYRETWVNSADNSQGQRTVEIANGELRINGKDYGTVEQGDFVDINGNTVQVNGAVRLPIATNEPAK